MIQVQHDHYQGIPPEKESFLFDDAKDDYGTLMMCVCGGIVIKFEDGCKYDQNPWQRHNHEPVKQVAQPQAKPPAQQPYKPQPRRTTPRVIRLEDDYE